jgi:hypothetical protein
MDGTYPARSTGRIRAILTRFPRFGTSDMTADAVSSQKARRKGGRSRLSPFAVFVGLVGGAVAFVAYVLWPTWPDTPVALDAPAIPVTVAGVLFQVPPAAIRATVQRHPGPSDRIDLVFLWPSLKPPVPDAAASGKTERKPLDAIDGDDDESGPQTKVATNIGGRLFVTIAPLGSMLPPVERLNSVYPQYVEAKAAAGPDGLAILPFRAGTPYEGEDLIYLAGSPDQFFARCSRPAGAVPGTCIHDRALDTADITLRFPRDWLDQWRDVAASFDRLIVQLHPQGK